MYCLGQSFVSPNRHRPLLTASRKAAEGGRFASAYNYLLSIPVQYTQAELWLISNYRHLEHSGVFFFERGGGAGRTYFLKSFFIMTSYKH